MSFAPVGQSSVSPELSGSRANLPDEVRDVIGSDADSVVFWAKADPAEKIATYQWWKTFGCVVINFPAICCLCCLPTIGIMLCCRARLLQVVVVVTNTCLVVVQGNKITHKAEIEHIKSIKAYRDEFHACFGRGCCPKTSMNIIEVDDGNVNITVSGGEYSSVHVKYLWRILGIYDSKRVKEEVMRIKQQIEESKHKAVDWGVGYAAQKWRAD